MHGTLQATPDSSAMAEMMVIDPVCRMRIDPATAAAHEIYNGKPVYFCAARLPPSFPGEPGRLCGNDRWTANGRQS